MTLGPRTPGEYLAHYGRSFHFATRLLPSNERALVAAVYAYCRITDNIVDEPNGASVVDVHRQLDEWHDLSRRAYAGDATGVDVVDRAMGDMRAHDVPFRYAVDLIAGVRMDLAPLVFRDLGELRTYTYRVAGVVGLWTTQLFGVREPWVLERAIALGHAMQLTNIVRDVGDDLGRGRVYLPESLMRSCGLTVGDLDAMRAGHRRVSPGYRAAMEALMATADASYRMAFDAMPMLPPAFRRSVAVAAEVYRGIHDEVRNIGYDTIGVRAATNLRRKITLGARGLRRLHVATGQMVGDGPTPRAIPTFVANAAGGTAAG